MKIETLTIISAIISGIVSTLTMRLTDGMPKPKFPNSKRLIWYAKKSLLFIALYALPVLAISLILSDDSALQKKDVVVICFNFCLLVYNFLGWQLANKK